MPSPQLTAEQVNRLTLVRYLLKLAESQLDQSPIIRALALLTMHDAAELLLDVAAEVRQVSAGKREFKDYWGAFRQATPPIELPLQRQMDKMNRARVGLKHHGLRPDDGQIREHLSAAKHFAEELCDTVLGVPLSSMSMAALIHNQEIRDLVANAQTASEAGEFRTAVEHLAVAFGKGARETYRTSTSFLNFRHHRGHDEVGRTLGQLQEAVENLAEMNSLVSIGLSLREYKFFRSMTPLVQFAVGGNHYVQWIRGSPPNKADVEWCLDFVIDFILKVEAPQRQTDDRWV